MLTLHLTARDLSRTVVVRMPSAMQELCSAGRRLNQPHQPAYLASWNAQTRAGLRPVMLPYLDLCGVPRWAPDFLTPIVNSSDFASALDRVIETPTETLRAELVPRIEAGQLPGRTAELATGSDQARRRLRAAALAFHELAVAPYWSEITAAVYADRVARGSLIVDQGIDRVLSTLSPLLHWRSSTLSYECPGGSDIDLTPNGRGVTLVPSYLQPVPTFVDVGDEPVVIVYPIGKPSHDLSSIKPLADLLGRTRAAVLHAVASTPNTTGLADQVGISPASASQHTAVLRSAGLITTHRTGPAVRHTLTPLGRSLLHTNRRGVSP
ncbi:hypothetical protein BWI15_18770 [Kribbella sp. ALI-6-A]|uniref:ArsR/SmtB family transcription factor n=1 Tax=Kribbella sp. ALI-6-A TaxID=1933817 RepID=UPI00097C200E|nr:winged helix-turn-helix domain-containing protein [Kribbella sp. ALI-6-A]ONI72121.1 hypothetical protein BWI15_18770 [Kribbella sp. ALI-6-A]